MFLKVNSSIKIIRAMTIFRSTESIYFIFWRILTSNLNWNVLSEVNAINYLIQIRFTTTTDVTQKQCKRIPNKKLSSSFLILLEQNLQQILQFNWSPFWLLLFDHDILISLISYYNNTKWKARLPNSILL